MLANTETELKAQPSTAGDEAAVVEAEGEGKAELSAEGKAESAAEPSDAYDLAHARQSIEAIALMADNLRVLLAAKK